MSDSDTSTTTLPELITPAALATRWGISTRTLANQRSLGTGLPFLRLGGRVAYRVSDVLAYEDASLVVAGR
ncbi:DNA-binding protein [Micromonospora sp. NPDC049891]|uniref:helix-turn-helix transcriptional regulator n=1 Tax=Micromonospora sp. NPDC049891 TaxID=3155655 RepID=UPI0033C9B38F